MLMLEYVDRRRGVGSRRRRRKESKANVEKRRCCRCRNESAESQEIRFSGATTAQKQSARQLPRSVRDREAIYA